MASAMQAGRAWYPASLATAGLRRLLHDAVVAAACPCAAGAGAVAAQDLPGGPAVQLHQVAFCAAAVEPGVAEVMPEPVREHLDAAFAAAAGDDLVDAAGGHRAPVVYSEPQLRPVGLGVPGADADVPVQGAGGVAALPERLAGAGALQPSQVIAVEDRDGLLGDVRGLSPSSRLRYECGGLQNRCLSHWPCRCISRSLRVARSSSSRRAPTCSAHSASIVAATASMRSYSRRPRSVSRISREFRSAGSV